MTAVGTVRPSTSRISQVVTLIAVIVPPLGLGLAAGLLWGVGFHWVDLALFAGLYVLAAISAVGLVLASRRRDRAGTWRAIRRSRCGPARWRHSAPP